MRHKLSPRTDIMQATALENILVSEISIGALLDRGLLVMQREMINLNKLSLEGKLTGSDSKDLREIVKVLFELKDREDQLLRNKTDEELRAMVDNVGPNK